MPGSFWTLPKNLSGGERYEATRDNVVLLVLNVGAKVYQNPNVHLTVQALELVRLSAVHQEQKSTVVGQNLSLNHCIQVVGAQMYSCCRH